MWEVALCNACEVVFGKLPPHPAAKAGKLPVTLFLGLFGCGHRVHGHLHRADVID
jgi:hypothetical protein